MTELRKEKKMYLELKNVRYAYDKQIVLNDINFSIEKGEITGLIGANGAGKTTTILNLTKKITPQSGEILVNGINLQNIKMSEIKTNDSKSPDRKILSIHTKPPGSSRYFLNQK